MACLRRPESLPRAIQPRTLVSTLGHPAPTCAAHTCMAPRCRHKWLLILGAVLIRYVDHWDPAWPEHEPHTPNWNVTGVGHHGAPGANLPLNADASTVITDIFKNRWRTLMSVSVVLLGSLLLPPHIRPRGTRRSGCLCADGRPRTHAAHRGLEQVDDVVAAVIGEVESLGLSDSTYRPRVMMIPIGTLDLTEISVLRYRC